jgi:hypothetical protein
MILNYVISYIITREKHNLTRDLSHGNYFTFFGRLIDHEET